MGNDIILWAYESEREFESKIKYFKAYFDDVGRIC
jgi:hypothetical protein